MPWGAGRGLLCLALLVEESTARRLHAQAMAIVAVARCPCGQVHSWANMDSVSMQIYCRNCVTDWRGNDRSCHHIACRNRDAPQSCQQHSKPWEIPTLGVTQGHLTFSCDKLWAVSAHNLSAVCNARHTLILDRHVPWTVLFWNVILRCVAKHCTLLCQGDICCRCNFCTLV